MAKILIFSVFLLTAMSLGAETAAREGLVISDKVRVRSQPSLTGAVVGQVDAGTILAYTDRSPQSMALSADDAPTWWYKVQLPNGKKGWIFGQFFYLADDSVAQYAEIPIVWGSGVKTFTLKSFSSTPDEGDGEPDFDVESLLVFDDGTRPWLVSQTDDSNAEPTRFTPDADGWVQLTSGMGGTQRFIELHDDPEQEQLVLTLEEQSNGGSVFLSQFFLQPRDMGKYGVFEVASVRNFVEEGGVQP